MADLLFWPALLAYGEAAVALVGEVRRPGLAGRLAIWGVRIGWLAQTGLLVLQASRAEGFPWAGAAGALNLFSWLVVGVYLIWGCTPRFRLLGLAVMPAAALLLAGAYVGGGIEGDASRASSALLAVHVALVLGAFAGFALAAGLSGLYLWHERRLKRRAAAILRLRVPPLDVLERLSGSTVAVSLAVLTGGIALGAVSLFERGGSFDATMAVTLAAWALFGAMLLLRRLTALRGRPAAYLVLAGFALAAAILPIAHYA
ncbi:MAG: cytochrome c biogenesis protein CcsA [Actinobacteria bacterium]|nr:cytochrome c biogenesis protein CcsA [Actinomycetota bacterium]